MRRCGADAPAAAWGFWDSTTPPKEPAVFCLLSQPFGALPWKKAQHDSLHAPPPQANYEDQRTQELVKRVWGSFHELMFLFDIR